MSLQNLIGRSLERVEPDPAAIGRLLAARPRVNDWYARMTSRPAYASAMPPAGSEGSQPAPG